MTVIPLKKLEKIVGKACFEWLKPLNFVLEDNGGCGRWDNDIYTYVGCVVDRVGGINRIKPFGQMGFMHIKKIYSHFMTDDPAESNKIAVQLQAAYGNFMRDWNTYILCQHEEEVEAMLVKLKAFIFDKLYPTLMRYTEPKLLLDLYIKHDETNKANFDLPVFKGYSSALSALIIARLHAPEHYETLKKRYQPIFDRLLVPEYKERSANLIAYLDQKELTPL